LVQNAFVPSPVVAAPSTEDLSDVDEEDESSDETCDGMSVRLTGGGSSQQQPQAARVLKPHLVFIAECLERNGVADFPYQKGSFHSKHALSMKFTDVCDSYVFFFQCLVRKPVLNT
jgi:hypothetical protein